MGGEERRARGENGGRQTELKPPQNFLYLHLMEPMPKSNISQPDLHRYTIADFNIAELTTTFIFKHSSDVSAMARVAEFIPEEVNIDLVTFREATHLQAANRVAVQLEGSSLILTCTCTTPKRRVVRAPATGVESHHEPGRAPDLFR